jgi:hypothetical protein
LPWRHGAIGADFDHQTVEFGLLTNARRLHEVVDTRHRRVNRINRQRADGLAALLQPDGT